MIYLTHFTQGAAWGAGFGTGIWVALRLIGAVTGA